MSGFTQQTKTAPLRAVIPGGARLPNDRGGAPRDRLECGHRVFSLDSDRLELLKRTGKPYPAKRRCEGCRDSRPTHEENMRARAERERERAESAEKTRLREAAAAGRRRRRSACMRALAAGLSKPQEAGDLLSTRVALGRELAVLVLEHLEEVSDE